MKTELKQLIEERDRLELDLSLSPTPVNYEGKEFPQEPTTYLAELNKKIAKLRKRG